MEDSEKPQEQWRETALNLKQTEKKFWSVYVRIVPTATSQCGINTTTTRVRENTFGGGATTSKNPSLL